MPTPRPVLTPVLSPPVDATGVGVLEAATPGVVVVLDSEGLDEGIAEVEVVMVEVVVEFGFV